MISWTRLAAEVAVVALLCMPAGTAVGRRVPLEPTRPDGVTEMAYAATADGGSAEVIVLLNDQADLRALPSGQASESRAHDVVEALRRTADASQAPLRSWLDRRGVPYRSFYIVNALLLEADRAMLLSLAHRPEVAQVMANPRVRVPLPSDELAGASGAASGLQSTDSTPWGIDRIRAPQVWALGYHGEGVVVAGQDTGYDWDHPALKAQYAGWDGATADHDYHWHDAIHAGGGACGPDSAEPCDDHGHGTHTMGTIVGEDGSDHQIGVAPGARWIGCRNMDQGVGTPASYAECFEFFLAPYPVGGDPPQGDTDRAPHVINNSWSCPPSEGCDAGGEPNNIDILEQVVNTVRAAGILVVSSAGNAGPACATVSAPPGMFDGAFTIGATGSDPADTIASFSSRGTGTALLKPDLAAPGVSVLSSVQGGGYGTKSGTSMAAPHVAGAAALLWSARPDLRREVTMTEMLLAFTAVDRTSNQCGDEATAVPNSVYGWGRLDALAGVQAAVDGPAMVYFPFISNGAVR